MQTRLLEADKLEEGRTCGMGKSDRSPGSSSRHMPSICASSASNGGSISPANSKCD